MNKKINVPMKFEMTDEVLNKNFHKVKLYVCHNGVNLNESHFSDSAIAKAKEVASVQSAIAGKTVVKEIYVKGKIINIVK